VQSSLLVNLTHAPLSHLAAFASLQSAGTTHSMQLLVGNGEERCSVIEARRLKSTCTEGECNANGLCFAAAPPSIAFVVECYDALPWPVVLDSGSSWSQVSWPSQLS
jgi:hypothetical protein